MQALLQLGSLGAGGVLLPEGRFGGGELAAQGGEFALEAGAQFGVFLFELGEPPGVGREPGAHLVGQHVHALVGRLQGFGGGHPVGAQRPQGAGHFAPGHAG